MMDDPFIDVDEDVVMSDYQKACRARRMIELIETCFDLSLASIQEFLTGKDQIAIYL